MYTVTLINRTLIIQRPDGSMIGQVYARRLRALRMYWLIAGRLDNNNFLSNNSCIER